jgi:hypothetical protein
MNPHSTPPSCVGSGRRPYGRHAGGSTKTDSSRGIPLTEVRYRATVSRRGGRRPRTLRLDATRVRAGRPQPAESVVRAPRVLQAPANRSAPSVIVREGVAEVYDAVSESALIKEFEVSAYAGRQPRLAPADDHGPDEHLALVDQAGLESLRREIRTSYGEIAADRGLQLVNRSGAEMAFE